jgi:beta-lactamase regulating signal transducer with metallopeptidase domain
MQLLISSGTIQDIFFIMLMWYLFVVGVVVIVVLRNSFRSLAVNNLSFVPWYLAPVWAGARGPPGSYIPVLVLVSPMMFTVDCPLPLFYPL